VNVDREGRRTHAKVVMVLASIGAQLVDFRCLLGRSNGILLPRSSTVVVSKKESFG
jgi:hypothetical protein